MLRYKEIKFQLEQMISSMQADEPLPSREALCRSLDTTRGTLHKAIMELAEEGKVYTRGGSGTYVAGLHPATDHQNLFVGLIVPYAEKYQDLIRTVEAYLQSQNVNMVLSCTDGDAEKQSQCMTRLFRSGISGLIIVPAYCMDITRDYVLFSRLEQWQMPAVFCYRGIDGLNQLPVVCYNNFYTGYMGTKHLIEKGYRHITYVAQFVLSTTLDRYQGYVAAMLEAGLEVCRDAIILEVDLKNGSLPAYQETLDMLRRNPQIDAIISNADTVVAAGIYQAIEDIGKRVSDDIGVVSINNEVSHCNAATPRLTSIGGKAEEIGTRASQTLLKLINGETSSVPMFVSQPDLFVRESCLGPRK